MDCHAAFRILAAGRFDPSSIKIRAARTAAGTNVGAILLACNAASRAAVWSPSSYATLASASSKTASRRLATSRGKALAFSLADSVVRAPDQSAASDCSKNNVSKLP